ncbi:Alpha/Beta hydrolase protein [Chlamydoabsidia padenii]|nr:Alpha/Beta hydrolase protein [Chlamydoabsidia padenii]
MHENTRRTFSTRFHQENTTATLTFQQPNLCDPTVVQYSGYIDVDANEHYFFWFFESRQNPDTAGLTLWLNGGPGCTSMTGLFEEVGPCAVNTEGTTAFYNEIGSWNKVTNMLFLDQPAGTGFSYGDRPVDSTDKAKIRAYQFLQLFFKAFPKYQKQPFHLFGESYAGHFIPSFARYIIEKNQSPSLPHDQYINLESIGIGNGITDVLIQVQYAEKMACHSSYESVLKESDCHEMRTNIPVCVKLLKTCETTKTVFDCDKATIYCAKYVENIYARSGRDIYDIRAPKDEEKSVAPFEKFLSIPHVWALVGSRSTFHHCSPAVHRDFYKTGDYARNFAPDVGYLLDHGIRALIYAGDADYRANWYGVHGWTKVVDFKASKKYRQQKLQPWLVDGVESGEIQAGGNLTFVRVYGAGHKTPFYKPKESLQMFTDHIHHIPM